MALSPGKRRHSPYGDRPNMSDLRIVLLGNNITENSRVENLILGRAAFESEAPSADGELHIEREKEKLKVREVTVINAPQLLNPDLSSSQITQTVKEIVDLSAPGPHGFILILQQNHFTEEDRRRVKYVLNEFSDEAIKHTIVLTKEEKINNDCIHQLIQECGGGHLQFDQQKSESEILVRTEKILKEEEVEFLICDVYKETRRETSVDEEQSRSEGSVTTEEEDFCLEDYEHFKQSNKEKRDIAVQVPEGVCVLPKLNVVLCGSDRRLKSSLSMLMRDQRDKGSELSSECVKLDGEVDGRLINLVELPVLTLLSQKEEMRQFLRCVSLCDPGVHVFLLVIPDGPLTDEDKAETEMIQKIFSSEMKKHTMVLIIQKSEHKTKIPNEAVKAVIECFGGRHYYLEPNTQVSMLVTKLEQMVEENDRRFISTEAFLDAQMEKFEETWKKLISLETQIQQKDLIGASDDLRIVLLGKTGAGKSATGNTILGRKAFEEDVSIDSVTKECQRQTADVDGRPITVIDTPGLFDTKLSQEEIQREITECISMTLPGPHVFLLLIPVGRFTEEEENAVKTVLQTFGKNSFRYTIVLFTKGDDLKTNNKTIDQYLSKPGSALMNFIEQCGNRYHMFNNRETENRTQVTELLQKINDMVTENGGSYYSCKIFRQMEREKQEAQMKMLMNEVEQLKKEREELLSEHEEEKDKMKMKLEEEKLNYDAEKKIREEEFKKSEEQYKTDMKREKEKFKTKLQEERQIREGVIEKNREKEQNMWDEFNLKLKEEREDFRKEKADLQAKHEAEIEKMKTKMEEERQNHDTEKRKKEEELKLKEEEYKTKQEKYEEKIENEKQRREEESEKMKEKEQNIIDQWDDKIKKKTEEITREMDRVEREKEDLQAKHKEEIEKMKQKMEEERKNHDMERRKIEREFKQREEEYRTKQEKYEEKIENEKQKREEESEKMKEKEQNIIDQWDEKIKMEKEEIKKEKERIEQEKEDLKVKHKEKMEQMRKRMEEEKQNYETERRRREDEFKQREEEYRTKQEKYEEKIEKEKQKREEESEKMNKKQQNITEQCNENIKIEREDRKREKERIEKEKEELQAKHKVEIEEMKTKMQDTEKKREEEKISWIKQNEILTKEIQNEKSQKEQQRIQYEDQIKLIEKQKEDELKPADYEEDRRKEIEHMKMCCSALQRDESGQHLKLKPSKYEELKKLYDRLDLPKCQTNKLGTADILEISRFSFQAHEPQRENELLNSFLQRLKNMDYRARYTVIKHSNYKSDIHPMDVQMAVFHCADGLLKQLMVTKLSQCQFALPLLVPDPFTQQIEFPLWTFRQINKSWKMKTTNNETTNSETQPIYKAETPMVFFFRFGSVSSSKSQLVNSLINEKHNTFFHRNCPGSSRTRLLMDGVVEIAWYCPSGKNTDSFDDCVAFCNLHGDAADNQKQYEILTSMSSVNVLFLPDFEQKNHYKDLVTSLCKSPQPLICLLTDNNCDKTELGNGNYKIGLSDKNQCDVSSQIRDTIRETLQRKTFRLEDVAKNSGIRVDEQDPECQRGKQAALKIMKLLRGKDPSTVKETILPCQGKLWHDWSKMNKELHHLRGENLEEDKSNKLKKMREIREKQVSKGLSEFMKTFIEQMNSQRDNERKYFLKWIMNLLDELTSEKLCELHKEHAVKVHEVSALKRMPDKLLQSEKKLNNISEQINRTNFGLEHILREIGQIYESWSFLMKIKEGLQFDFRCLPSLAAEMMISGFPLELMDGDAAHVPLTWVSAVLGELVKKLGDQRLFVLSVLGIQSSGKSTMLNALFGLQFAVSAGRCTRGAFMQLLRVSDEMKTELKFDYMLVVDTEGLRAPELSRRSTTHRDNELATFVVGLGNMTLINIFGENPAEMQDILQIVVQAFMRMKKIKLNPSCMFVHQNVTDITAGERNTEGRIRLEEKLDTITKLAANEEDCDAERFSDVIAFDVQKDVKYFSQLWEGNPPMAPPNPNYCENILELKKSILTHASQSDGIMLTHLRECIEDLWEALLSEQFVFSFKNSLEISTYKKLETEYSKWSWSLRSAMLEIEQKLHNKIENEAIHDVDETDLQTELKAKSEEVKKKMSEFFAKDKDANTLNQWKASFEIKIKELQENIVRETMKKLNGVLQQRHLKKNISIERTRHENILFEKSKELALKCKDKATDEKTMRTQFDSFWRQQTTAIIGGTPFPKYIDIIGDAKKLLNLDCMGDRSEQKDIFSLPSHSEYVKQEKSRTLTENVKYFYNKTTGKVNHLAIEEELQIKNLISDIADQTNKMIQLFNIVKMGYNITYIQQLIDNIKTRLVQHETGPDVKYVFKKEFFIDLVLCICHRSNKTFTDQYQKFREANDPVLYFERMGVENYRIFQKYCQGASSTAIFGQFVCNKLKEPIKQSVYKTTARALADEMKTNCESLNGNRSNLEKHILKTLAEKQDFDAFMRYINNPKDHFKSFIRDEVSQYITEGFEESVQPKMENSIKLLQQQIMNGVQESSKHIKENNEDNDLWLHHFTQQLSGALIFSESDLIEVNQDGVDVSFLEEVIKKELPSIMSDICKFSPKTFMENLEPTDRPDEILIAHLCQCCWVQCPFCAAICTNTIENHDKDHSVTFHRNNGLNGWSYRGTTNLSIDICTSAVASDRCFYPNSSDDTVAWKEYRKGGPKYASWSITPDLSELPYWKWFVCRFQQDLEKHYEKTYDGSGKIPDEWRKHTQEDAVESLNKYI